MKNDYTRLVISVVCFEKQDIVTSSVHVEWDSGWDADENGDWFFE